MSKLKILSGQFCIILSATIGMVGTVWADSGELAYAYPAEGITIDGDLSDWPQSAVAYTIGENLVGDPGEGAGQFRVAYSLVDQAIYVGLELLDPISVTAGGDAAWFKNDSHLLYIDFEHTPEGSAPFIFTGIGPDVSAIEQATSWSPAVRSYDTQNVEYRFARTGDQVIYEWKISAVDPIVPGTSIGLDHMIVHNDDPSSENPDAVTMWGRYSAKSRRSARLGDVFLVDPAASTGRVRGQIGWQDGVEGPEMKEWRIRVQNTDNPNQWIQPRTDETGHFDLELPVGRHTISSPFPMYQHKGETDYTLRIRDDTALTVDVTADTTLTLPPFLWGTTPPPVITSTPGVLFDFKATDADALTHFIDSYMDHYSLPGASVALVRDGQTVYARDFGVRNVYTRDPVTPRTLFEAGSITKMIFAYAVMRMAETGVIDLDTPLHTYLEFDEIADDPRHKLITARHILSHQTGLPNWRNQQPGGVLSLTFIPGTDFGYSGEGFEYLGRVMTHLTGKPLEDILLEHAQVPMGFTQNLLFKDDGTLITNVAFGHDIRRPNVPTLPQDIGVAYSLQTNAHSLANFMSAFQNRTGLSADSYEAMLTPQVKTSYTTTRDAWPTYFGLGIKVMETPFGHAFGHSGLNGSNHALFETYDAQNAGFIVLTNSDAGQQFYQALREFLVLGKADESEG